MKEQNRSPGPSTLLRAGFTLVEIMIVVGLVAAIFSFSVFCFSRARLSAQEAQAQGELNSYNKAITEFMGTSGRYPKTLAELGNYMNMQNAEEKYVLNPDLPQ